MIPPPSMFEHAAAIGAAARDHVMLRAHIDRTGISPFALRYQLDRRTVERIYSGAKPCPPRLLETIRKLEGVQP